MVYRNQKSRRLTALGLCVALSAALGGVGMEANAAEKVGSTTKSKTAQTTSATRTAQKSSAKAEALYLEGRDLTFGLNGKKVDEIRGVELLKEAMEAGSFNAQAALAFAYWDDNGCAAFPSDRTEAFELAFEPARAGNPFAALILVNGYYRGFGVAENVERGDEWLEKAKEGLKKRAEAGDVWASCLSAVLEKDVDALRELAEENVPAARELVAAGATEGTETKRIVEQMLTQGSPDAETTTGIGYGAGSPGYEKNPEKAIEYFKSAAKKNRPRAALALGSMYYLGEGVEKNLDEARRYFRQAADAGNAYATLRLGQLACDEEDWTKAVEYWREAANDGESDAMFLLGTLYLEGLGVGRSREMAAKLYRKAAEHGSEQAARRLEELGLD